MTTLLAHEFMSRSENRTRLDVGLGLRARKGGAVVVGVALVQGEPSIVLSGALETCADGDRLSFEPYKLAAEIAHGPQSGAASEVAAVVAKGRERQNQLARNSLQSIVHQLEAARCKPVVAALLVNRAGWITDLLDYSLAWPEHVPIAEVLAVRDALRFACSQCGIELVELDEKSLLDLATKTLDLPSTEITARLKALGSSIGNPWRKEQKLACLSALIALTRQH